MTGKNDDAASRREDSFLASLMPQVTENLAERHAAGFDAEAGQARFLTWLAANTKEPASHAKGRAGSGYTGPRRTGWAKRLLTWPAVPVPEGRFLTWLSGAQWQILRECPTERPRYAGLGASILISAAMASVSIAFALVTALNTSVWVAVPVAFASSAAVLSLTRLAVVSMPRGCSAGRQLLLAVPRLAMAVLMGFVVSVPFMLQIFQPEIQHQITVLHNQAASAYYEQAITSPLEKQVTADQAQVSAAIEALARAQTGGQAAALKQELSAAQRELQADQAALRQQTAAFNMTNQDDTGLLIRLQALDAITADNPPLATARWLLVALLVLLDCTPILLKVLLNAGPASLYERMLAEEEKAQLEVAEYNRRVRRDAQMMAAEAMAAGERSRLASLRAAVPGVNDDIIAARRRVEAAWLRRWEEDQMLRLAEGGQGQGAHVPGIFTGERTSADRRIAADAPPPETEVHPGEIGYRGPAVCAAAGITSKQLDYWSRTGLVDPSVRVGSGSGAQPLYSFRDILMLKVVRRLLDTGVSLQQVRAAVQHLRSRGTEDLAQVTLMSDGESVYECTSPDEVVDLLAGGQGVFGIALGRVWHEVEADLTALPAMRAEPGFTAADPGTIVPAGEEEPPAIV